MMLTETTLHTEVIHQGKIITLRKDTVRLPNGRESTRDVVVHPGAVCVFPLTAEQEVILVRQYRHATGKILLEAPAGTRDPEEMPEETARRELLEETGYTASEWIPLGEAWTAPGFCTEYMYYYLAKGLTLKETHLDADEFIQVEKVPFAECVRRVIAGEIVDNKTMVAILRVEQMLNGDG